MPSHLAALSDKALIEQNQKSSDEVSMLLSRRYFGKVTPAVRKAWPSLRRTKHVSVHAARRLLEQAKALATPAEPGAM